MSNNTTIEGFWLAFNKYAQQYGKFQRQGQMLMNVMASYDKVAYDAIRNRNADPFYDDGKLAEAIEIANLYLAD